MDVQKRDGERNRLLAEITVKLSALARAGFLEKEKSFEPSGRVVPISSRKRKQSRHLF